MILSLKRAHYQNVKYFQSAIFAIKRIVNPMDMISTLHDRTHWQMPYAYHSNDKIIGKRTCSEWHDKIIGKSTYAQNSNGLMISQ